MKPIPLILDCDPGVDDAVALALAFGARERLDLLGITTTAGNVELAKTTRNACLIRQIMGRETCPSTQAFPSLCLESPSLPMIFMGQRAWAIILQARQVWGHNRLTLFHS